MHRYFSKRSKSFVESSSSIANQERINVDSIEFNLEDIISDPGLRKPIESYDVRIRNRIRREYISKGPCQPKGHIFPKTTFGKENRSFQVRWFEKHRWLEYGVEKDAAFCFWCYLFKPLNVSRFGVNVFVSECCKNWKKALNSFKEHEGEVNSTHNQGRMMVNAFNNQRQSIEYNWSVYDKEDEVNYRLRLTASLDVIRLLLCQGLPFRGHDESSQSLNRGNFLSLIDTTKEILRNFRENGWVQFLGQVEDFCIANSIDIINIDDTIKSRVRIRRDGCVTNYHHYKVEIYYQVLDLFIQEMEHRFPEANTELLTCMNCLSPRNSFANFNIEKLVHLAVLYPDDFSWTDRKTLPYQIRTYITDVIDKDEFSNIKDLGNLAKILVATRRDKAFPLLYRLIELTLILLVATASVERVFSAMKLIKTDLRSRMGDEWLNGIMVVYNEREILKRIDNETILQRFQGMANRQKQLSSISSSVSEKL